MTDQHAERRFDNATLPPHGRRIIGAWLAAKPPACIAALEREQRSGLATLAGFALIFTVVGILILLLA